MRKAFTLIELLVVISIIALLIAILLPALSSAKYQANVTKCSIAVRSIGMVQISYAADSKEYFPEAGYRFAGVSRTTGQAYSNGGSWTNARDNGARIRSWELFGSLGGGYGPYDLRKIYYDYMQNNNQEEVMHCPMKSEKFYQNNQDDRILSYNLYVGNNYRWKHFYMENVGGYERLGDTWSPQGEHEADFTLVASDFAFGCKNPLYQQEAPGALVSHPAPNGSVAERYQATNDLGGFIVDESQDSPNNFADADGSVHTYKINATSVDDTDTWVVNTHSRGHDALLPRDLAR